MALYIAYLRIYGTRLPLLRRQKRHGWTLRRLRAMSGSAGYRLPKSLKRERIASKGRVRSLLRGFAGLAAGQAVLIVKVQEFKKSQWFLVPLGASSATENASINPIVMRFGQSHVTSRME